MRVEGEDTSSLQCQQQDGSASPAPGRHASPREWYTDAVSLLTIPLMHFTSRKRQVASGRKSWVRP